MRPTILVVDDDPDEREALVQLLRRHDFDVESATNGRQAIERARHGSRPDLVVLDLNMAVMNGWEFLAAAGQDGALRDMPVVITSGAPIVEDTAVLLDHVTFVAKPLRPEAMMERIHALLHPEEAPLDGDISDGVPAGAHPDDLDTYPLEAPEP
jgi:CheY-like chemotaxis protein